MTLPLPKNYSLSDNGASIYDFTSQYHHNSGVHNLLTRDPSVCWFTSVYVPLPQHVIIDMGSPVSLSSVGMFLHGENNQNPSHVSFHCGDTPECTEHLITKTVPHRGGDFIWLLECPHVARYVKYTIIDNFGGSGGYTTKLQLYGTPASQ